MQAIEPCELHRVYPPLTEDTDTGNGTGERAVTGGKTALAEAHARAALAEARLSDFKTMLDDIREQRDRWQQQAERAGSTRDYGSAEGTRTRTASVVAANAPSPHRAPPVSVGRGPSLWGRSAFNCSLTAFERPAHGVHVLRHDRGDVRPIGQSERTGVSSGSSRHSSRAVMAHAYSFRRLPEGVTHVLLSVP